MKKTEENVNIEISSDENIERVRDIDVEINLGDSSEKIFQTEKIVGLLDSLIISTDRECDILITFDTLPDIEVYNNMQFSGTKIIPVRQQVFTPRNELLLSGFAHFMLNNALSIRVRGQKQTKFALTIRVV